MTDDSKSKNILIENKENFKKKNLFIKQSNIEIPLRHSINDKFRMQDLENELLFAENFLRKSENNNNDQKNNQLTIEGSMIPNNDKLVSNTSQTEKRNPNFDKKKNIDPDLAKYQKQIKNFGFPEIGNFNFQNLEDKEKTLKFFDFLFLKKSSESEEKMKYKKQIDILSDRISSLQSENSKLEKDLLNLSEEIKKINKDKKDFESKHMILKETTEKQISDLKGLNLKLTNRNNALLTEKKAIEEKYNKLSDNYLKIINKNNNLNLSIKASNHIDMIENLKRNDVIKLLAKVKGTEKLIQTFKNGFNESLRELLFEISALKNFIYEVHEDLIRLMKKEKYFLLEYNLLSLPFLDSVQKIKFVFKQNFGIFHKILNKIETNKDIIEMNDNYLEFNCSKNNLIASENKFARIKNEGELQNNNDNDSIFIKSEKNIKGNIFQTYDEQSELGYLNSIRGEENEDRLDLNQNENDYENELEFLKNKWIRTLMSVKNDPGNEN